MTNHNFKEKKKLITHNGSFHADDIFATAMLLILLERKGESGEVIRSRDPEILKTGDYVFDVGGVYDAEKNLFDHHQVGGAGKNKNGIEYSSFGLVWKKFGAELCESSEVALFVEKKLVSPIDAWDNGFDLVEGRHEVAPYYIQNMFFVMQPTWQEDDMKLDEIFLKCVEIAKIVLVREIVHAKDTIMAEKSVISIYQETSDKRIIVLDKNYPVEYTLDSFPEPLFLIYPRKTDNTWGVKTVRKNPKMFDNRKDFPKAWGGLKDEELQKVSGVSDAIFCHRALFLVVAKSKEGAIKLAQIAVES